MTLGSIPEFRRMGLASVLVDSAVNYAETSPDCGAVFLHVIHYNTAAIKLYERNRFHFFKELTGQILFFNVSLSHLYFSLQTFT